MKLTKKKLEQLIMEEYVRAVGDEYKPTNYPQYRDKLTALSKNDPHQARELAGSLDEPLDVEYDPNKPAEIFKKTSDWDGYFDPEGPYFAHSQYVIWAQQNGYPHIDFSSPIDNNILKQYTDSQGLDYQDTLMKVKENASGVMGSTIKRNKFDIDKEFNRVHDAGDPFGYDPFEED